MCAIILMFFNNGEVSEWSKVIDSKSIVPQGTVGSNPTLSAIDITGLAGIACKAFLCLFLDLECHRSVMCKMDDRFEDL